MVRLLDGAGVRRLVDVRTAPGSRHNPDATRSSMSGWLPEAGIGYRWEQRLGGWRKSPPDSPDTALRSAAFAGYAAYMRSPEFRDAIDELATEAVRELTTVMCAESVWWRCHRKMIADFLVLAREIDVRHLMHDGALRPHRISPQARLTPDRTLVYDLGQARLIE